MNTAKLKILTWNCKGAYRKKQKYLLDRFDPDIWVIQECEHPEKFSKEKDFKYPENYIWYGDDTNRGVAIFSSSLFDLHIEENHNPDFRYVVPIKISGIKDLKLFAIWAMNARKENRKQRYISQIFCAFNHYELNRKIDTLIIGDYNWNIDFDHNSYSLHGKFTDFLDQMNYVNYQSVYHNYFDENYGQESHPTLYLQGKKEKPFHIDYIFGNQDLINKINTLIIGEWKDWRQLSDHMPIYAEFINY